MTWTTPAPLGSTLRRSCQGSREHSTRRRRLSPRAFRGTSKKTNNSLGGTTEVTVSASGLGPRPRSLEEEGSRTLCRFVAQVFQASRATSALTTARHNDGHFPRPRCPNSQPRLLLDRNVNAAASQSERRFRAPSSRCRRFQHCRLSVTDRGINGNPLEPRHAPKRTVTRLSLVAHQQSQQAGHASPLALDVPTTHICYLAGNKDHAIHDASVDRAVPQGPQGGSTGRPVRTR